MMARLHSHSKGLHSLDDLTTLKKNCLNIFLFLRQSYKVVHDIRARWLRYLSVSWQPGLMWLLWPARAVSLLPRSTQIRGPPSSLERLIPKHGCSPLLELPSKLSRSSSKSAWFPNLANAFFRKASNRDGSAVKSIHRRLFWDTGWTRHPQLTQ